MCKRRYIWAICCTVLFVLIASTTIRTCPKIAILIQEKLQIPGSSFYIGNARIRTHPDWLLVSCKRSALDHFRFYGILPIPDSWVQDTLPGPYFFFTDVSRKEKVQFAFVETEKDSNDNLTEWLKKSSGPHTDMPGCHIESNLIQGASGLQCSAPGGWIMYVPELGMKLIMHSKNSDLRPYFDDFSSK